MQDIPFNPNESDYAILNSFALTDTDFIEVYSTIMELQNSPATSIEDIPTKVLKIVILLTNYTHTRLDNYILII